MDNLLCAEEAIGSPWNVDSSENFCNLREGNATGFFFPDLPPLEDSAFMDILIKEQDQKLDEEYISILRSHDISTARSNAVHWMIKVRNVYNFQPLTVALGVSYMDRYLSKHLTRSWKAWMMHLLAVACMSLAAKMEETSVPLLCDLQSEGLDHLFEPKTIQRMELTVLSFLGWKMNAITSFQYIHDLLHRLDLSAHLLRSLSARIGELVLGTYSELEFLIFGPSVIALASIVCALEEIVPLQAESHKFKLLSVLPIDKGEWDKCYKLLEELVVDPICQLISTSQIVGNPKSPPSPVTVADVGCQTEVARSDLNRHYVEWSTCVTRPQNGFVVTSCLKSRKRKADEILN